MNPLIINEPPLQVLPSLAKAIGLNEAIVLQQVHYWLVRSANVIGGQRWVYNSVQQWSDQFPFWSIDTIERTLKKLRASGILVAEHLSGNKFDRTLYYRIDYAKIPSEAPADCANPVPATCGNGIPAVCSNGLGQDAENSRQRLHTENTQETTATVVASPAAPAPEPVGVEGEQVKVKTLTVKDLVAAGVERKHANDWLATRRTKKLPLTESALDVVKAEAAKAGVTLAEAIKVAAENSWAGFKASWLQRQRAEQQQEFRPGTRIPNESPEETRRKAARILGFDPTPSTVIGMTNVIEGGAA